MTSVSSKKLSTKRVYKSYVFDIYIYKQNSALNNIQSLYVLKLNLTNKPVQKEK